MEESRTATVPSPTSSVVTVTDGRRLHLIEAPARPGLLRSIDF